MQSISPDGVRNVDLLLVDLPKDKCKSPISFPRGVLAGDRKRRPPGYFARSVKAPRHVTSYEATVEYRMQPIWAELLNRFPKLRMRLGIGTYLAYSGLRVRCKARVCLDPFGRLCFCPAS